MSGMDNSTSNATGLPGTDVDIQANTTAPGANNDLAWAFKHAEFLALEVRIVGTALALIYIGCHASLRRPPSANLPKKSKDKPNGHDESEDDAPVGLMPSDAVVYPLMAGTILVSLYHLIKWLEDPAILNKILGIYFSFMSLAGMSVFFTDGLRVATSFIFPDLWHGEEGTVWYFDGKTKSQYRLSGDQRIYDSSKKSPFPPGRLSSLLLSSRWGSSFSGFWNVRSVLLEHWNAKLVIHGSSSSFRLHFHEILGVVLAVLTSLVHYQIKSTWLSNLMGSAFSYTGIILMSPTTFATGSSVLFGLFIYDIYMVFYTPYMVTVATKLDVPIKLTFGGPSKSSMLGLGDIVLPGMFIGLVLRFDLYMHYHRQRKLVPIELTTETADISPEDTETPKITTNKTTQTQYMVVKPDYVSPQGQWGNSWHMRGKQKTEKPTPELRAAGFRKTYFRAAMGGYLVSMIVTLVALLMSGRAQPALLYLVPGVVTTVWATALFRGELRDMWAYTEDGSLDTTDVVVEVDESGNIVKEIAKKEEEKGKEEKTELDEGEKEKRNDGKSKKVSRVVFSFTVEAPETLISDGDMKED